MLEQILITIIALVTVLAVLFLLFKKPIVNYLANFSEKMAERNLKMLEERNKETLKEERERFKELSDEKMKRNEQYFNSKKDAIKELIEKIDRGLSNSQRKIENTEKARISEFSNLKTVIAEHKMITGKLKDSTENLKNILSNNQLRGKYGEEVAENLLKIAGFVKGINYDSNLSQETNANRPDFTIYLPDKTKVNIDVKFPYSNLQKYQEVESEKEKREYFAKFKTDVKQKIKQITNRDYINPEEKTLDFVILFVPNEMIFSVINDKLYDVVEEANNKKVAIVGPVSFITFLRIIHQSYDNFKIQEDLHRVVNLIGKFKEEFNKYNNEFDHLGNKLKSLSLQYDKVSGVRTRQLSKIIDQIDGENVGVGEGKKLSNS
ncbi:MAG: DNA recombination protein RmuC [Candidatus Pacebacteria bacterium]|nr:DNA recombination protein RmuC [Candidatus Paceibacterota bacterium]